MIQEFIDEIKVAEAKADFLTSEALREAGELNLQADVRATEILEAAKKAVKLKKLSIIEITEKNATDQCSELIKNGEKTASDIKAHANIEIAAKFIVEKLLEKHVGR
ncbi:MAG: hypothetical protein LBE09_06885 [Christensenellaceae bacterium]|jgi:vacuolar-type H+-ATPase subunit H|nr:hypothetical protein [Christensenellaceae bacterium]